MIDRLAHNCQSRIKQLLCEYTVFIVHDAVYWKCRLLPARELRRLFQKLPDAGALIEGSAAWLGAASTLLEVLKKGNLPLPLFVASACREAASGCLEVLQTKALGLI